MPMIERVVSGGQTGVDRAALDAAIAVGIPCGGWCPKGRIAEDGAIPDAYSLRETPTADYSERTRWNVRDSDGTLIVTWGPPTNGSAYTVECAVAANKHFLICDLDTRDDIARIRTWLHENGIRSLNVAGPRESKRPGAYATARALLEQLFAMRGQGER